VKPGERPPDDAKVTFESLQQTNQELASNPEISRHNKQVLEDFFRKARSGGAGDATPQNYASRFNKLCALIDFKLDQPERQDLEGVVAAFNRDDIRKDNGERYADYSKNKFWKAMTRFYQGFIKSEGKGYVESIDGPKLLEDMQMDVELSTEVDSDSLPAPEQVAEVAEAAESLRDTAIVLFGWATGARVGELFSTQYNENTLKWNDLTFESDKLWVALDGKSGNREIPVKTSMAAIRQLWESGSHDLDDPVFTKNSRTYYCPKCGQRTSPVTRTTYENREYQCQSEECSWKGGNQEVDKRVDPLTDHSVRRLLERAIKRAGMQGEFDENPHDFFRKSRAIYKARIGYSDHQMRGFFGWSETSDAPKHYLTLVKEDLEKALAEEFGEEVDYTNDYDEEALRPVQCASCDTINEATTDMCRSCGTALTQQGAELTRNDKAQELKKTVQQIISEKNPDADKKEIKPEVENFLKKDLLTVLKELGES
jgi:integrase